MSVSGSRVVDGGQRSDVHRPILREDFERVRVLKLNRPTRANAWGDDMAALLREELAIAEADPEVHACVLTGAGQRAFSSGADVGDPNAHAGGVADSLERMQAGANPSFAALQSFVKPLVAAVRGHAIGAGFLLTLCCDAILVAPSAKFALTQVPLGVLPAYGGIPRLAQWVGRGRALDIATTGRQVLAEEAVAIGLAIKMTGEDDIMDQAVEHAGRLGALPPLSFRMAKESMNFAMELGSIRLSSTTDLYRSAVLQQTEDSHEAHEAWRERRDPHFKGR